MTSRKNLIRLTGRGLASAWVAWVALFLWFHLKSADEVIIGNLSKSDTGRIREMMCNVYPEAYNPLMIDVRTFFSNILRVGDLPVNEVRMEEKNHQIFIFITKEQGPNAGGAVFVITATDAAEFNIVERYIKTR